MPLPTLGPIAEAIAGQSNQPRSIVEPVVGQSVPAMPFASAAVAVSNSDNCKNGPPVIIPPTRSSKSMSSSSSDIGTPTGAPGTYLMSPSPLSLVETDNYIAMSTINSDIQNVARRVLALDDWDLFWLIIGSIGMVLFFFILIVAVYLAHSHSEKDSCIDWAGWGWRWRCGGDEDDGERAGLAEDQVMPIVRNE